jgi:LPXTG-site transpeptidase (sortase) family protein
VSIGGCGAQALVAGTATCLVTYAGTGSHSITAVYGGDANFTTSTSAPLTQTVNAGNTGTALTSSVNPSVVGQNVTYTATVTASPPGAGTPTGTVDFQDGGVSIAGCGAQALVAGTATCTLTYAVAGSHTITAIYSGDTNFSTSTSAPLTQTIGKDPTTTSLSSSVNPSVAGQTVTFTATVTANPPGAGTPTGTVDFQDGGVNIAGCVGVTMVGATASCVDPGAGTHTITAIYSGDANFLSSTSAPLIQTVNQDPTTTSLGSSANPSVSGQTVTFTAIVTPNPPGSGTPTGTVTFRDGGANIAGCVGRPLVGATATCSDTFVGGSHSITATFSGDPDFLTSTSGSVTELILPGLPNTSGPQAGPDAVRPNPPEGLPGAWPVMLALIAGLGLVCMVVRALRGYRVQFRHRRRRVALGALPVLLSLVLGMVAGSLLAMYPSAGSTSPRAQERAVAEPGPDTVLIGRKVVTVAKPPPTAAESFHPAVSPILPTRLRIPSIGVDSRVVGVGLLSDGSMDVPDNLWTTAWLSSGARPGQPGPTVIAGHRGIGTPAVFSQLENVRPGARIFVSDSTGAELVYEVTGLVTVDLSPSAQVDVFGPTQTQQLVLITCFGKYSSRTRTYDNRLVVVTRLLPPNS